MAPMPRSCAEAAEVGEPAQRKVNLSRERSERASVPTAAAAGRHEFIEHRLDAESAPACAASPHGCDQPCSGANTSRASARSESLAELRRDYPRTCFGDRHQRPARSAWRHICEHSTPSSALRDCVHAGARRIVIAI